jgi:RNA polymerase sigma factor (sigma-70 family)
LHQAGNQLSERERQVLALLAEHLTNTEIAERLGLSHETVKTHVNHILQKLGAEDRREAARWWRFYGS